MTLPKILTTKDPQNIYNSSNYLVLDFETTSLEKGSSLNRDNKLLLACWRINGESKSKWGGEYDMECLAKDIASVEFVVAHNAAFELGWLLRCGVDLRKVIVYDTMLAEWVLLGNLSRGLQDLSLSQSCVRRGVGSKEDVVASLIHQGVDPQSIPPEWLIQYCHQDVAITEQLFLKQRELLVEKRLLHIQLVRCLLTPALVDMQFEGLTLDKEAVYSEYEAVEREYSTTQIQLDQFAKAHDFEGINWRSNQQVAEFLYDVLGFSEVMDRRKNPIRTGTGARKADVNTIHALKCKDKHQKKFIQLYTRLAKLAASLSKSLNFFKAVCDEHGGTFYGSFNQGTTKTHRLSSSGRPVKIPGKDKGTFSAQLQNVPREYKTMFKARAPDWKMFEADSGQLEFRVAAILTRDPVASKEIIEEADIHQITADYLTKAGEPTNRQEAKSRSFRPLFAGTSGTKAEQAYCKFFQEKYNVMYNTQYSWVLDVLRDKELITPYGMRYSWPYCKMESSGYIAHTTEIFNAPIQGFATAEIIPIALIHAWHRLSGQKVRLTLTIHDSVVGEVHESVDPDYLRKVLAVCFTRDVYKFLKLCYNYDIGEVPLAAGVKIGDRWGQGDEHTATVYPTDDNVIHWAVKSTKQRHTEKIFNGR